MTARPRSIRAHAKLLLDLLLVFLATAILIRPLFKAKYLDRWASIESTFIADGRFLAAHWPHPLWQPLWYCGTRFDYIYPPVLRYGTALLSSIFIPVKAYHVFTAIMFCLGIAGVYFLVRVMCPSRLQAWLSAAACALLSPSFLFIREVRDDAPHLIPARLGFLLRYGEGPHMAALALLPFAVAFAFTGMRRSRPMHLALAAFFCALVALTNFYGATALAIFYPILAWTVWVGYRERFLWLRALAIPALAYGVAAFWLTPSYLRITLYNLRYVSHPGNQYSVLLTFGVALLFGVVSFRWASVRQHLPRTAYCVFVAGGLLVMALNVIGHQFFNFRILGEPARLIPELDMTMILAGVEILRRLWIAPARFTRSIAIAAVVFCLWPVTRFLPHAWGFYPKDDAYKKRVEYRVSGWMAAHMPDSRTYVAGSIRFWWDAWHDLAQVGGGSDQGVMNPNPLGSSWEIHLGPDPAPAILWLASLGADAVIVSDSHSQETYHDFQVPYKFAGVLPVLFDDHEGNVIYRVPRRYPSLARVVDTAQSKAATPLQSSGTPEALRAYNNMVEHGPDSPTATKWLGTDSISVHAAVQPGQSVLVQVTYDPAWRAYSGGLELPIRQDAMDFMAIDAPPGDRDIVLVFETPRGNKVGNVVTILSLLTCLCLGIVAWRTASPQPETKLLNPVPTDYPMHLRIIRMLLRWLYRHLPPWTPNDTDPFDPEKLRRAELALRDLHMPDAGGGAYLEKHMPRLARTLALVPPPQATGRVLELGCYMQITPLLQRVCGYPEVRGAYFGPTGKIDRKTCDFPDGQFECYVDHFDVEREPFPYPDEYFDLVVATEIIEHMTYDPMWMLLEARRVLAEGGYILLSTPNVGSVTSVAKTLDGRDNPQIFFLYDRPGRETEPEIGHMREYTLYELGEAARAAGFETEILCTTFIEEWAEHRHLLSFLALNGYSTENRGEQSWCLARKRADLPVDRYPWFIYSP